MWFGTGIHWALEQFYSTGIRRDPVEAWKTWFNIQWRGGTVTADWLDKVHDLKPKPVPLQQVKVEVSTMQAVGNSVQLYQVRGLEDILPYFEQQEVDDLYELGIGMMTYYKQYAEKNDDFVVVCNEHVYSVPIWDFENDCILKAIDTREESPNYGKVLEVHARGRMDQIKRSLRNDKISLMDNKTAGKWGEEELRKLESDEQCTNYLWAAEIEATYYDLPHKGEPFEELLYNVLRKAYPKPPTMLKNGMFSVSRNDESTTYDMLMDWISTHMPGIPLSEKQQGYISYLRDIGDENFIIRRPVRRNRHQLRNAGYRIYLEALDMLDPNTRIYPNISNSFKCLNCAFRAPCMAKEDGGDWEELIKQNYITAKDR
jgi:hypothetical protein